MPKMWAWLEPQAVLHRARFTLVIDWKNRCLHSFIAVMISIYINTLCTWRVWLVCVAMRNRSYWKMGFVTLYELEGQSVNHYLGSDENYSD